MIPLAKKQNTNMAHIPNRGLAMMSPTKPSANGKAARPIMDTIPPLLKVMPSTMAKSASTITFSTSFILTLLGCGITNPH